MAEKESGEKLQLGEKLVSMMPALPLNNLSSTHFKFIKSPAGHQEAGPGRPALKLRSN